MRHTKKQRKKQLIETALEETQTLDLLEKDLRSPIILFRAIMEDSIKTFELCLTE